MTKHRYTQQAQRRRNRKQVKRASWLIVACAIILIAGLIAPDHCTSNDRSINQLQSSVGDLETVITNKSLDSNILHYTGMTISFNPTLHIPNWVAYELTADEARGEEPRTNKFLVDNNVPGCASPDDYRNTGYDRGHMAPAADMKWSTEAMKESFYMTNIVPQANALNRGTWSKIEDKCRQRALNDSAIIIISGLCLPIRLIST